MADFHRIRPCEASQSAPKPIDRGWRIRLSRFDGDIAQLVEEQTLPERVERVDAHRVPNRLANIPLTTDEVRWLRDALSELLPIMEEDDATAQAEADAMRALADDAAKGGA